MHEILFQIVNKAYWLKSNQKTIILSALADHPEISSLSFDEKKKLCAILCTIPSAEGYIFSQGNYFLRICTPKAFHRTLGSWSLNQCHAAKFGLPIKRFRKYLINDSTGIYYIISYLVKYIGIHKSAPFIFAEYLLKEGSTTIATLQRYLNLLLSGFNLPLLNEDGLLGKKTKMALFLCQFDLSSETDEREVLSIIEHLRKKTNVDIGPSIPKIPPKKRSFRDLRSFFYDHIEVQDYVNQAINTFNKLYS